MARATHRVGVVGIGFGERIHVPALRMDPRFEVRAICASSFERAEAVGSRLSIPRAFGDWRKLVIDPEIDVVAIATPPNVQSDILESAIDAGKDVFLEKPVGGGAARATELARRASRAGVVTLVDFEFEAIDVWIKAEEFVRTGRLGRLRHAIVDWNVETYAHRESLTGSWKRNAEAGGGTLNSFVSHCFRYLEWMLGPIVELEARLRPDPRADDLVHAWLKMRSGAVVSLTVSSNSRNRSGHKLEIHGERGFLALKNESPDYAGGFELTLHADPMPAAETSLSELGRAAGVDGRIAATARLVSRLGDAIERRVVTAPSLSDGARVECLIEWARRSDRERHCVETEG
jgi:predicted dehydrogenase